MFQLVPATHVAAGALRRPRHAARGRGGGAGAARRGPRGRAGPAASAGDGARRRRPRHVELRVVLHQPGPVGVEFAALEARVAARLGADAPAPPRFAGRRRQRQDQRRLADRAGRLRQGLRDAGPGGAVDQAHAGGDQPRCGDGIRRRGPGPPGARRGARRLRRDPGQRAGAGGSTRSEVAAGAARADGRLTTREGRRCVYRARTSRACTVPARLDSAYHHHGGRGADLLGDVVGREASATTAHHAGSWRAARTRGAPVARVGGPAGAHPGGLRSLVRRVAARASAAVRRRAGRGCVVGGRPAVAGPAESWRTRQPVGEVDGSSGACRWRLRGRRPGRTRGMPSTAVGGVGAPASPTVRRRRSRAGSTVREGRVPRWAA